MCVKRILHCGEFNAVCTYTHYSLALALQHIPELSYFSLLKAFFFQYCFAQYRKPGMIAALLQ
jgi:hypothetical protein